MSYVALLLALFLVDMAAAISPCPNFVLVTQTAIQRSVRHALAIVAGFATTNLSIFALFMKPHTPVWVQSAAIAIVIADTLLWYGTVALFFWRKRIQQRYAKVRRAIDGVAGTVMTAFGARLILTADQAP